MSNRTFIVSSPHRRLVTALATLCCANASAADFLVDSTSDQGGAQFQICDANGDNANCSLRGALNAAAASPGPHAINFNIPKSDPGFQVATAHWRVDAAADLPFISRSMVIDGYTQPGSQPNTLTPAQGGSNAVLKIEVRGPGAPFSTGGFYIGNGDAQATIRGLAINGFASAILVQAIGEQRVEGCFIGTDITGTAGVQSPVGNIGVRILLGTVFIGGDTPAARNVISGNRRLGVWASSATGLITVQGNLIGTNAAGTAAIPRQEYGIYIDTLQTGMLVGGVSHAQRNVISGNDFGGIYRSVSNFPSNGIPTRIEGNWLGTDVAGVSPLPNGVVPGAGARFPAIYGFGGGLCGMSVGGTAAGAGNLIAHSGGAGVQIASCRNAPVLGNTFFENGELPIDVSLNSGSDGPTPNDPGDVDASGTGPQVIGGNRLQNTLEILSMVEDAGNDQLRLNVRVDATPTSAAYPLRIDIYRDDALGTYPVATRSYPLASAQQSMEIVVPLSMTGTRLAFEVTDADGNSGELLRTGDLFDDGFEPAAGPAAD